MDADWLRVSHQHNFNELRFKDVNCNHGSKILTIIRLEQRHLESFGASFTVDSTNYFVCLHRSSCVNLPFYRYF